MKTVQYEKDIIKFDDYPDGIETYFFYIQKKLDGVSCWVHDGNELTLEQALKMYPKSKFDWQEITEDI